ncbi:MAG: metallophosphoesterase [Candidatus Odinarchaeia archaeon]
MTRVIKYSKEEIDLIWEMYLANRPYSEIINQVNNLFHNGQPIRTYHGITKTIHRLKQAEGFSKNETEKVMLNQNKQPIKLVTETSENKQPITAKTNKTNQLLKESPFISFSDKQLQRVKQFILDAVSLQPVSLGELSYKTGLSKSIISQLIDALHNDGYDIELLPDQKKVVLYRTSSNRNFKTVKIDKLFHDQLKMLVVSDTHLGSKYQQLTLLHSAYEEGEKQKVQFALHGGDLIEGMLHFTGHINERFLNGADEFKSYVVEKYPKTNKFKTHIIASGEHDLCFKMKMGYNIVRDICAQRSDLVYEGENRADFLIKDKFRVRLFHPSGGVAYSLSYHPQKFFSSMLMAALSEMSNLEDLFKLLIIGHYHSTLYFPQAGVQIVTAPCFKSEDTYLLRKALSPVIGFWIFTFDVDSQTNVIRCEPKLYDLTSKKIKNDY